MFQGKILLVVLVAGLVCGEARPDGGTLRLRERAGNYNIAVFTSPALFRAGPVDVSVLVQDSETGAQLPKAQVTVRLVEQADPWTRLEYPATLETATNKLFHAAEFELPRPGRWEVEVETDGPSGRAVVRFEVEAAEAIPRWREVWPWIAWPAGAVLLFAIHQMLVRLHQRRYIKKSEPPLRSERA